MCSENIKQISLYVDEVTNFISKIKFENRKVGQVGLIIGLKNAIGLYEEYVDRLKLLKYIPLYKISQDHIELFFGAIRVVMEVITILHATNFNRAIKNCL